MRKFRRKSDRGTTPMTAQQRLDQWHANHVDAGDRQNQPVRGYPALRISLDQFKQIERGLRRVLYDRLSPEQLRIVRGMLTSGNQLDTLKAPPGTGKADVWAALAGAWIECGGRVFGVSPIAEWVDEMRGDDLIAYHVNDWLADPPVLTASDYVVIDEAQRIPIPVLDMIWAACKTAHAKTLVINLPPVYWI
jgi:hypothetical protein